MSSKKGGKFIKIQSDLMNSDYWKPRGEFSRLEAYAWLLDNCAFKDGFEVEFQGHQFKLKKNQLITTYSNLEKTWGWGKKRVKNFISKLTEDQIIEKEGTRTGTNGGTILTVVIQGVSKYQGTTQATTEDTFYIIYLEVLEKINKKIGKKFNPKAKSNQELMHARLMEGYTKEDLLAVVDYKCEEWGDNDKMRKYIQPSTLFAKTKFEGYLVAARDSKPKRKTGQSKYEFF